MTQPTRGGSSSSQALRDGTLKEFVLVNVELFGKQRVLGIGSYGSVQEVKVNGEVYAAKMIHDVLLETDERGGVETVAEKYLRECRLISRMRHPNITQFIGICFLAESHLPLLVMERLEHSVDELVETTPTLPFSVSMFVLLGVCRGLLYLHHEGVVHRDLTARNVLLTASLKAKISDFGNSRIVRMEPGRLVRTLTRFPGTLVYMAPEALSEPGQYGPSLDVFSFGVLMLFILTQVFPGDLLSPTYPNPSNPGHVLGRSEFERRSVYTTLLERNLVGGRENSLFGVVRECLSNSPERRPTTTNLLSSLEEVWTETERTLLHLDIARVKTFRSIRVKEQRIEELQKEVMDKDNLLADKETQIGEMINQLADITERNAQLVGQQEIYQAEISAKDSQLAEKEAIIAEKDRALAEKNALIQENPSRELRPPLILKWKKGKDMPFKAGYTVQSVVIDNSVYVGGSRNDASMGCSAFTVMKLDLQRDEWTNLPPYHSELFAMVSLSNRLVLLGGYATLKQTPTNQVGVFKSGKWTFPYKPMNIARFCPTAVCFNRHIVVAGGWNSSSEVLSSVEVLDVTSNRWYIAMSLPVPRIQVKSTLIGNTLYLMGGRSNTGRTKEVHKVDLSQLIEKAILGETTPTIWQAIEKTPSYRSAPLCVKGSLLAVGGCINSDYVPISAVHLYQPDTRRWVKVGDLPIARYYCTCSVLPSGEVIVAGGETGYDMYINDVDFLSITNAH